MARGLNKYYGDADISAKLAEDVLNVLMVSPIESIRSDSDLLCAPYREGLTKS